MSVGMVNDVVVPIFLVCGLLLRKLWIQSMIYGGDIEMIFFLDELALMDCLKCRVEVNKEN